MTATPPDSGPRTVGDGGSSLAGTPRRLVALVGYVLRACLPARRLAVLALPVAATLLTGPLSLAVDGTATEAFSRTAVVAVFGLAIPLGTLVVGDAVLGAEVRSGTLGFTWMTPAPFAEIVLGRFVGGWLVCLATFVPAAAVAAVLAGAPSLAAPIALGVAAGSAGHVAVFVVIGCLTRRAAVWSLGVVFLVERLLGAVLSGVAQLSPTWLGRAVMTGIGDVPSDLDRSGVPDGVGAIVRLGLVVAVCLAVATWGLSRLQLTGARD